MPPKFRARTWKILRTDYQSFLLLLFSIGSAVLVVTLPLLFLFLPLLYWRVSLIKQAIESGETVTGLIASKRFYRGEWVGWYVFKLGDEVYKVRNALVTFKLPFEVKQPVVIAYDPSNPRRAFLTKMYGQRISEAET